MRIFTAFIFFAFLLAAAPAMGAAEAVVYVVSHYDRPGYGGVCSSTEVFSISTSGGTPVRAFSDAGLNAFKLPCLDSVDKGYDLMAVNPWAGVLYARVNIFGGRQDVEAAIVEIALDGSGHYRKLVGARYAADLSHLFVNTDGDAIGTWDGSKFSFLDSKTGVHLSDSSTRGLSELLNYKCDIGNILGVGWLDHDQKVFLTLGDPAEEDLEDPKTKLLGTWAMQKDGSNLKRIGPPPGAFAIPGYRFDEEGEFSILLLGQTPSGDYVYMAEMQMTAGPASPVDLLAISHPGSKPASNTATIVSTDSSVRGTGVSLSPGGDFVAYATAQSKEDGGDSGSELNSAADIMMKPLTDGPANKLTTYVPDLFYPRRPTNLWVIGWLEN